MTTTPATTVIGPLDQSWTLLTTIQQRLASDVHDPLSVPALARMYGRLRAAQRRERDSYTRGHLAGMGSAVFGLLCARRAAA